MRQLRCFVAIFNQNPFMFVLSPQSGARRRKVFNQWFYFSFSSCFVGKENTMCITVLLQFKVPGKKEMAHLKF